MAGKKNAALRLEFVIPNAPPITVEIDLEEAMTHAGSRIRPSGIDDLEWGLRCAANAISDRLKNREGFFAMTDVTGRYWIIPAAHVVAANVLDLSATPRRIGFEA